MLEGGAGVVVVVEVPADVDAVEEGVEEVGGGAGGVEGGEGEVDGVGGDVDFRVVGVGSGDDFVGGGEALLDFLDAMEVAVGDVEGVADEGHDDVAGSHAGVHGGGDVGEAFEGERFVVLFGAGDDVDGVDAGALGGDGDGGVIPVGGGDGGCCGVHLGEEVVAAERAVAEEAVGLGDLQG